MKLFVAVPVYQDLPVEFAKCLLPLWPSIWFLQGESLISRARNRLSADFLRTDCTHCLFIDCDVIFTLQDVVRLTSHDEAIIGGIYPIKRDGELLYAIEPCLTSRYQTGAGCSPCVTSGRGSYLSAARCLKR